MPKDISVRKTTVMVWVSVPKEAEPYIDSLKEGFEKLYPKVKIALKFKAALRYQDRILDKVEQEKPPDAALLSYNDVLLLHEKGALIPIDEKVVDTLDDFLKDALDSIRFNGKYYALPWLRFSKLPAYLYLAIFKKPTPEKTDLLPVIHNMFNHFTAEDQQIRAYEDKLWYPTRKSAYEALKIMEPRTGNVLRVRNPVVAKAAIDLAGQQTRSISRKFGFQINSAEAVAISKGMEAEADAPAGAGVPEEEILYIAAPVLYQKSSKANDQLAHFGALFIRQPKNDFNLEPGNYVISYFETSKGEECCQATRVNDRKTFPLPCHAAHGLPPVSQPVALLMRGSICASFIILDNTLCIGNEACCNPPPPTPPPPPPNG